MKDANTLADEILPFLSCEETSKNYEKLYNIIIDFRFDGQVEDELRKALRLLCKNEKLESFPLLHGVICDTDFEVYVDNLEIRPTCPVIGCKGELYLISSLHTDMGYLDYDRNDITETFECNSCQKEMSRSYKWVLEEKI